MAETIEAFVNRLQEDGVKAGQEAAAKVRSEAEQQASQIIEEARSQAKAIVEQARSEGEQVHARTETELKLAVRDAVTRLQETFGRALKALLEEAARGQLSDPELLKELIKIIVSQYAQADTEDKEAIAFNVSHDMRDKLTHWVIEEFHAGLAGPARSVNLQATLKGAGLEYKIKDGTVEITVASVVDILSALVGPEVRKFVSGAVADA